jgi:GNAT superfamily N-acetyltransferase
MSVEPIGPSNPRGTIELREILHNSPAYGLAVALRTAVLRQPLGLAFSSDQLQSEVHAYHLGAFLETQLLACLMLQPMEGGTIRMRQVAVQTEWQGQGLGRRLVNHAETVARQRGFQVMTLHARESAVGFYQRLGYSKVGPGFVELTLPHWAMHKPLVRCDERLCTCTEAPSPAQPNM